MLSTGNSHPPLLRYITIAASLLLSLLLAGPATADQTDEAESKLHDVQQRIAAVQQRLRKNRRAEQDERAALGRSELAISLLKKDLRNNVTRIARQDERLQSLGNEARQLRAEMVHHRTLLAHQVRNAFINGRQDAIKLILNQEDPAAVGRLVTYHGYISRARQAQIEALQRDLTQLNRVEQALAEARTELIALRNVQRQRQQELHQEHVQHRKLLDRLAGRIRTDTEKLADMQADEKRLTKLLEELRRIIADVEPDHVDAKPFAALRGALPWPHRGKLVARYGSRREATDLRWQGVVIAARPGDEVRAVHSGRVAFSDWLRGFGLITIIDHGHGYMTLYGHAGELTKETGDWINRGDVIAYAGDSAGRDKAGVYFAIRKNGKAQNPVAWCAASIRFSRL